jgi:diaminohydroxyphosphoribosylaminopyrimidine deaminase/5-amino-6-(5-phosphoribosylamino)uracil reductase
MNLRLPQSLKIFDKKQQTIIFNKIKNEEQHNLLFCKIDESKIISQISDGLFKLKIQSVLVEGGSSLLQSFVNEDLWDEARVIVNESLFIGDGLKAPVLTKGILTEKINLGSDTITLCYR